MMNGMKLSGREIDVESIEMLKQLPFLNMRYQTSEFVFFLLTILICWLDV